MPSIQRCALNEFETTYADLVNKRIRVVRWQIVGGAVVIETEPVGQERETRPARQTRETR